MVRVSSFNQQQLLLRQISINQTRVAEAQRQSASLKTYDSFEGLSGNTSKALDTRSLLSRTQSYQTTIDTVRGRLDANDVYLEGVLEAASTLRQRIQESLANKEAQGFTALLENSFEFIAGSLNTSVGGAFLFAGSSTATEPVNVKSLAELQALTGTVTTTPGVIAADVLGAFDNAATGFEARVADGVTVEFGLLANEVGADLFASLHNLYTYDQSVNTGPVQGELTDEQFSYLQSSLVELNAAIDHVRQIQLRNGLSYGQIDVAEQQHEDAELFLRVAVADIENVDLAEVATRLSAEQTALEASYQATATLGRLSLLQFL